MRLEAALLSLTTLLLAPSLLAGQGFEGVIRQREIEIDDVSMQAVYNTFPEFEEADSEEAMAEALFNIPIERVLETVGQAGEVAETDEMTTYVKGNRIRVESSSAAAEGIEYVIIDMEEGAAYYVMPAQKAYMSFSQADAAEMKRQAEEMMAEMGIDPEEAELMAEEMDAMSEGGASSVRPLGQAREINGMRTEAYRVVSDDEVTVGWCAKDEHGLVGSMKELASAMESSFEIEPEESGVDAQELLMEHGIPVLVQTYSWSGYQISELLEVRREIVSDELFQVPADFTARSMLGEGGD